MSIACRSPTFPLPGPTRLWEIAPTALSPARWPPSPGRLPTGWQEGGVLPVLKHIPGHGRAGADSHKQLPVVGTDRATLEATDFAAFAALSDLPMAMTAHVVFTAIDPVAPATVSATIVREVIRGFDRL